MNSHLSQQLATIRTAEALEQGATARAARPRGMRKAPRVRARIAARVVHR